MADAQIFIHDGSPTLSFTSGHAPFGAAKARIRGVKIGHALNGACPEYARNLLSCAKATAILKELHNVVFIVDNVFSLRETVGGFHVINRRRTMVKLLVWTRGGFTIVHKRLERGTFARVFVNDDDRTHVEIDVHELSMLLEGIELTNGRTSARWEPTQHARAL